MRLNVRNRPRHRGKGQRIVAAQGIGDGAHRVSRARIVRRIARLPRPQNVAVIAARQPGQPLCPFVGGQPVEDRHAGGDILLQIAQHHVAGAAHALDHHQRQAQAVRQQQPQQDDQQQPGKQRARPDAHSRASIMLTGIEKT